MSMAENIEATSSRDLSRERFKKPEESMAALTFHLDTTGEFGQDNQIWSDYTGQTAYDASGFGYLNKFQQEDRPIFLANMGRGIDQKRAFVAEVCLESQRSGEKWMLLSAFPNISNGGNLTGWEVNAFDINEPMAANRRHRKNTDAVTGLIAHEVRTPIQIIDGNASIMDARLDQLTIEEIRQAIADIRAASTRLKGTVEDLINFAKMGSDKPLSLEPQSTYALVHSCVEQYSRAIPGREIIINMGEELAPVEIIQARFNTILGNLLSNANKYSPPNLPIEVHVDQSETEIIFAVKDQGAGISQENMGQIFRSFFRVEATRKIDGIG